MEPILQLRPLLIGKPSGVGDGELPDKGCNGHVSERRFFAEQEGGLSEQSLKLKEESTGFAAVRLSVCPFVPVGVFVAVKVKLEVSIAI